MVDVLSGRDVALLRAVADGRCEVERSGFPVLYVDGTVCCDTSAAYRLVRAGLVEAPSDDRAGSRRGPAELTEAGRAELGG